MHGIKKKLKSEQNKTYTFFFKFKTKNPEIATNYHIFLSLFLLLYKASKEWSYPFCSKIVRNGEKKIAEILQNLDF